MADALKDASERAEALNTGVIAASFFSNVGHSFRRGEFFAGLFILGFSNGIFGRLAGTIAQGNEGADRLRVFVDLDINAL